MGLFDKMKKNLTSNKKDNIKMTENNQQTIQFCMVKEKLDSLFLKRNDIIALVAENIDILRNEVCADKTNYATSFDFLGLFSPSLIVDIITGEYKKGRIVKNKPHSKNYVKCYYDQHGNILLFENYGEFGCDSTYYFVREQNKVYIVPFIKNTNNFYYSSIYIAVYDDMQRIKEFYDMSSSSIVFENYQYVSKNKVMCKRYYYVPHKVENQLQKARIDIQLNCKKVIKLDYYEINKKGENLTYSYFK